MKTSIQESGAFWSPVKNKFSDLVLYAQVSARTTGCLCIILLRTHWPGTLNVAKKKMVRVDGMNELWNAGEFQAAARGAAG